MITRKLAAMIIVLAFLLMFATLAFGGAIQINTGRDLASREWPDGTELILPKDAVLYVDRPIRWSGKLSVIGNGAWLKNRQKPGSATFNVSKGHTLFVANATLSQSMSLTAKGWRGNTAVLAKGGIIELRNVWVSDGQGCEIWACDSFTWIGGGAGKTTTYGYSLYAGNNLANAFADRVLVQDCTFRVGRKESSVRLMGASAQFVRCSFTSDTAEGRSHRKESTQARYGDIKYTDCKINGSMAAGGLDAATDGGKHAAYAAKHPTTVRIEGGTFRGYLAVAGNTTVTTKGVTVTGKDARGVGGETWGNFEPHVWKGVTMRPQAASYETAVNGFSRFGAPGWKKTDCQLNGEAAK